jgi:hypothetical protein
VFDITLHLAASMRLGRARVVRGTESLFGHYGAFGGVECAWGLSQGAFMSGYVL